MKIHLIKVPRITLHKIHYSRLIYPRNHYYIDYIIFTQVSLLYPYLRFSTLRYLYLIFLSYVSILSQVYNVILSLLCSYMVVLYYIMVVLYRYHSYSYSPSYISCFYIKLKLYIDLLVPYIISLFLVLSLVSYIIGSFYPSQLYIGI